MREVGHAIVENGRRRSKALKCSSAENAVECGDGSVEKVSALKRGQHDVELDHCVEEVATAKKRPRPTRRNFLKESPSICRLENVDHSAEKSVVGTGAVHQGGKLEVQPECVRIRSRAKPKRLSFGPMEGQLKSSEIHDESTIPIQDGTAETHGISSASGHGKKKPCTSGAEKLIGKLSNQRRQSPRLTEIESKVEPSTPDITDRMSRSASQRRHKINQAKSRGSEIGVSLKITCSQTNLPLSSGNLNRFPRHPKVAGSSTTLFKSPSRRATASDHASNAHRMVHTQAAGKISLKSQKHKRRCYFDEFEFDGIKFRTGDDVYVQNGATSGYESDDAGVEECRVCGLVGGETMLECDCCLGGFHLSCSDPPMEEVPEGDWLCTTCEKGGSNSAQVFVTGRPITAREKFFAGELWVARIKMMWREADGSFWFRAQWFILPEKTAQGRQAHNRRREIFRSSESDDNEMESIVRHCHVTSPEKYRNSSHEGDDVYLCEYEYSERWCKFKRIEDLGDCGPPKDNWNGASNDASFGSFDDSELELEDEKVVRKKDRFKRRPSKMEVAEQKKLPNAANIRRGYVGIISKIGKGNIAEGATMRPQTDFERAKAALSLSATPTSLPCRDRERKEIASIVKDFVAAGENCCGQCLYISGVPGTGKTATVLEVIKSLWSKVKTGELAPYRYVEVNGLRLPSPEHAYTVLHEALTGQHVGWKRALQHLDERFSKTKLPKGVDGRPCVLLVDELDLLVTRNQSVLYNIFDWPNRLHSRLLVIGIANTMDLPERLLPRIASRMGLQRISFSPYSFKQLEEIISARLKGMRAFERQAAEFASRKVAAVSGDVRRALELCRRAVEIAESRLCVQSGSSKSSIGASSGPAVSAQRALQGNEGGNLIGMADIDGAIREMFQAPQMQMMRRSSKLSKIFLVAMVQEHQRTTLAETTFEQVAVTCSKLCASNGESSPDWDTLLAIGCKLGASRFLLCEHGAQHRIQKMQLNFPVEDVSFALKNEEEIPWLAKYL